MNKKELLKHFKEKGIQISKYNAISHRVYFKCDCRRYCLSGRLGELYEEYSLLGEVGLNNRYFKGECFEGSPCYIDLYKYNGNIFRSGKDTYKQVNNERFLQLLEKLFD